MWGLVGHGVYPNASVASGPASPPKTIVVSRSHAGKVSLLPLSEAVSLWAMSGEN